MSTALVKFFRLLTECGYTIIDEADEMLHMDWEEDLRKIMAGGGEFTKLSAFFKSDDTAIDTNEDANHRYLMFSATFNKEMRRIAKDHLNNDYVRIRVGRAGSTHLNVHQRVSMNTLEPNHAKVTCSWSTALLIRRRTAYTI